jgi:regulatory protein
MTKITALREHKGRRRVNVFLDGKLAFSLSTEEATREGLKPDQIMTPAEVDRLSGSDRHQRCLTAATGLLSHRPRSSSELSTMLQRRGFDRATQEPVLATLKEQGLLDDTAFARFWTENRELFSPRSQRLTRIELRWSDRDQFRRRLGGYLQRRGFGYGVVEATLARLWEDTRTQTNDCTDGTENR